MRNRFILFAIDGKVMGGEWGLTQAHGKTRSISVGYGSEMGYLLKSCSRVEPTRGSKGLAGQEDDEGRDDVEGGRLAGFR